MRIHADTLTRSDIAACATEAGVGVIKLKEHGSRSRNRAFEVALTGSGVDGGMYGNLDYPTATWDEWGVFLHYLFVRDGSITIPRVYKSHEHFNEITCYRFIDGQPDDMHKRHRWVNVAPYHFECKGCSAEHFTKVL